jgi:hypothetical protein
MTHSRRGRSSPMPAAPDTARVDERNPIWNFYHVDKTQSWGPISASVFSRPAGEVDWRSDYHRIAYDPVGFTGGAVQVENGPMRGFQYLANQISFVPRGVAARFNTPVPIQVLAAIVAWIGSRPRPRLRSSGAQRPTRRPSENRPRDHLLHG